MSSPDQSVATEAVQSVVPGATTKVTTVGDSTVRVQTDQLTPAETQEVTNALAEAYAVPVSEVTSSFIGPSWGADVTRQSLWGLAIFLALTFLILALYFRTWKMSVTSIIGLLDVLIITIGVYALCGFEISPGGGDRLPHDPLVRAVRHDRRVRQDPREYDGGRRDIGRTFGESVNLAVNQTLIRSINTTVVAILPTGAILFIGALWLGAQTLTDISLAIFVGTIVAAYSTLFVAAPLYSLFRENEPDIKARDAAGARRTRAGGRPGLRPALANEGCAPRA